MSKVLTAAFVFAAGIGAGWLVRGERVKPPAQPGTPYDAPVAVRRGLDESLFITPHAVIVDGRYTRFRPTPDAAPEWMVSLDGGRVRIYGTAGEGGE